MRFHRDRQFLLFGLDEKGKSWRGVGLLALIYLGAMLFASFFAPVVYFSLQAWAERAPNALNTYLAAKDFPRYFDRVRWLPVLLFLPWLLKHCDLWSWTRLGYGRISGYWRPLLGWFLIGWALLMVVAGLQTLSYGLDIRSGLDSSDVLFSALGALVSALIVALLEETIFRGVVLRLVYSALETVPAILLSALFFAFVHFKKIPSPIWTDETPVNWLSGFVVGFWTLLSVVTTFDPYTFATTFLAGVSLSIVFLWKGSLWPCVGLHPGWVGFRLFYRDVFELDPGRADILLGTTAIVDGLFTIGLLALFTCGLMSFWSREVEGAPEVSHCDEERL